MLIVDQNLHMKSIRSALRIVCGSNQNFSMPIPQVQCLKGGLMLICGPNSLNITPLFHGSIFNELLGDFMRLLQHDHKFF